MSKQNMRALSLVALVATSVALVIAGFNGWVLIKGAAELPMQYAGYLLGGAAVLGACGVNIWAGGPLDLKQETA